MLFAIVILVMLLFSKNVYQASLGSYYTFYLIEKFGLSVQTAQFFLVRLPDRHRASARCSAAGSATGWAASR